MKKTISRAIYSAVLAAIIGFGCGGDDGQSKGLNVGDLLNTITGGGTPPATYTLTVSVSPSNGGGVSRSPNNTSYKTDEQVTVTATAADGWMFTGWSDDVNDTAAAVAVTMNRDLKLTANFVPADAPTHTLTVRLEPSVGGNVSREPNRTVYSAGEQVAVTATALDGYTFTGWAGDASGANATVTVTMNRDLTLNANFQQNTYSLSTGANPASGGTVSRDPPKAAYTYNERVTVTAVPATGYSFIGWENNAAPANQSVTITMDGNKTLTAIFEQQKYTLATNISPAGYGSVLRNPNKETYAHGEQVTVTATETPPNGDNYYAFDGWTGSLESKSAGVTITMDGNKTLTANFTRGTVPYYTLTTITNPNVGTISRNPDNASYRENQTVTVTAPTVTGYTFTGWSGDATGTANPVTVTINKNMALTANYTQLDYTLTTNVNPAGGGQVSRTPYKDRYGYNETVSVSATANPGYEFTGWSDASTSTNANVVITMNSNQALTANFKPVTYTLNTDVSPIGGGNVSRSPNKDVYLYNETVTVSATAANGYVFTGWSGASTSKEASVMITMNGNKTLTANFQQQYTVIVSSVGTGASGSSSYAAGATVTITAGTAPSEYRFKKWTTTSNGVTFANANSATTTFTMPTSAVTVTANFEAIFITDSRNGQTYRTVRIGNQTWMAENMNYQTTTGSWCYGEGSPAFDGEWKTLSSAEIQANCNTYGRLYTWNAAKTVCPAGWKLPDSVDWSRLYEVTGGYLESGRKLKSTSGWGWANRSGNGTDDYGFSAMPGGYRNNIAGNVYGVAGFYGAGFQGAWWTATECGNEQAYVRGMSSDLDFVGIGCQGNETFGNAVRCISAD